MSPKPLLFEWPIVKQSQDQNTKRDHKVPYPIKCLQGQSRRELVPTTKAAHSTAIAQRTHDDLGLHGGLRRLYAIPEMLPTDRQKPKVMKT